MNLIDTIRTNLKNYEKEQILQEEYKLVPTDTFKLGDLIIFSNFNSNLIYKITELDGQLILTVVRGQKHNKTTSSYKLDTLNNDTFESDFKFNKHLLSLKPMRIIGTIKIHGISKYTRSE